MGHKYTFDELLAMDKKSLENLYEKSWKANSIINNQKTTDRPLYPWTKFDTKDIAKTGLISCTIIFSAWSFSKAIEKFAPRRKQRSQK